MLKFGNNAGLIFASKAQWDSAFQRLYALMRDEMQEEGEKNLRVVAIGRNEEYGKVFPVSQQTRKGIQIVLDDVWGYLQQRR